MILRQCFFMLVAVLCWAPAASAVGGQQPNLILFLIDDQDFESISAYGRQTWTPNLDRMAAEGMRFTRAHVSSTVCTPSRYTWLTGRYAGASTSCVYDDACGGSDRQGFPSFNVALERDCMNVGHLLREAGYTTGFVGKFHFGSPLDFPEFYSDDGLADDAKHHPNWKSLSRHDHPPESYVLEVLADDFHRGGIFLLALTPKGDNDAKKRDGQLVLNVNEPECFGQPTVVRCVRDCGGCETSRAARCLATEIQCDTLTASCH